MTFIAKLVKHSQVWKAWRNRHAVGGEIEGVRFRSVSVDEYESVDELTVDQVNRLRGIPYVRLAASGSEQPAPEPSASVGFVSMDTIMLYENPDAKPFDLHMTISKCADVSQPIPDIRAGKLTLSRVTQPQRRR
jgi:hypothetical protein